MIPKKYRKLVILAVIVQVFTISLLFNKFFAKKDPLDFGINTATHILRNKFETLPEKPDSQRQVVERISLQNLKIPNWQRNLGLRRNNFNLQYYLTAVVRVRLYEEDKARWTVAEFKQWMHYQFWAGAEHIYVCNHFLNESERIEKPLEKYVELGLVTFLPWNHIHAVPGSKNYPNDNAKNQDGCYRHVLEKYGNQSTWQYNFDMDENAYCPNDQTEGFLTKFLTDLSASDSGKDENKQVVEIKVQNFLLCGQGDRNRNIVYDRINRITSRVANGNWKAIYKPKYVDDVGMHGVVKEKMHGLWLIADTSKLKMLHYWGARLQDWGPDTPKLYNFTIEFNDVRNTIAESLRYSLLAFNETDAFSCTTGP